MENSMSKITYNGQSFDFDEIRRQMDPDLAEQFEDTTKTDQDFFDSYLLAHSTKYGEHFVVD
jgi:anti-CRISPR protein AcrIC5